MFDFTKLSLTPAAVIDQQEQLAAKVTSMIPDSTARTASETYNEAVFSFVRTATAIAENYAKSVTESFKK